MQYIWSMYLVIRMRIRCGMCPRLAQTKEGSKTSTSHPTSMSQYSLTWPLYGHVFPEGLFKETPNFCSNFMEFTLVQGLGSMASLSVGMLESRAKASSRGSDTSRICSMAW